MSSSDLRDYSVKIVALLLIVEAVTVFFLWASNPVTQVGEDVFAILFAVDLISFAMISYVYRNYKSGQPFNRGLLIGACCLILVLIYTSFVV